jgi:UDP-3-O-[3-hydroxymyristoyl] glucosamine N-acyltransferase
MEFTAQVIADFLQGNIEGDPGAKVTTVAKIEEANEGTLAFLANPKYTKYLYQTEASIVLINKDFEVTQEVKPTLIRVDDAYQAFASLLQMYEQSKPQKKGIDEKVSMAASAEIDENVYLGAFTSIGENVKIGKDVKIFPNCTIGDNAVIGEGTTIQAGVSIYHECKIGARCIIHSGTVVGSDGFGFAPQNSTDYQKIPQVGNVIIEDDVEIGANVTIDRATMGSTIIRKGVKIDNLVQIAHNVEIGENTVIVAQVGIAGSTKIGKNCMFAGQVGIVGHITIGDNVKIAAQSGVSNSVKDNEILLGSPGINVRDARKSIAIYRQLPKIRNQLIELEKEIEKLKNNS